jgi:hypothetical protein
MLEGYIWKGVARSVELPTTSGRCDVDKNTDSSGLPDALKAWLFPHSGLTRDFATLQVILGQGVEFYASDKDGRISNTEPEPSNRRTNTLPQRRFSSDLDHFDTDVTDPRTSLTRRSTYLQRRRTIVGSKERPLSIASSARPPSTSVSLDSIDSYSSTSTSPTTVGSHCSCEGRHIPRNYVMPSYQDAGVQTTEDPNMERLQMIGPTVRENQFAPYPSLAGNMQHYFRSETYQLGDFFRLRGSGGMHCKM